MHIVTITDRRMLPEEGLLLGNGDIAVCVYHGGDYIGFRLGKGDVWDRRFDYTVDPDPVDIDELRRGLHLEKWKCGPYGGAVETLGEAPKDPKRVYEVCQGAPKSYNGIPYPCPKPVGEFELFLPPDLPEPKICSELIIEKNVVHTTAVYATGVTITVDICVHPEENLLKVQWAVDGWNESSQMGCKEPVRMAVMRWRDPSIREYETKYLRLHDRVLRLDDVVKSMSAKPEPLEPPAAERIGEGQYCVVQRFAADLTYPKGFECAFGVAGVGEQTPVEALDDSEACVVYRPENSLRGTVFVGIESTGRDGSRAIPKLTALLGRAGLKGCARETDEAVAADAERFWSQSAFHTEDTVFERMWYEILHVQKAVLKRGKTAPGLFIPGTISDYSMWKGDYHTNYNIQEPYWSTLPANHPELMHPYFGAMIDYFLPLGKMLANKYYHVRGAFIQLTGFPMLLAEDPICTVPMGRMLYMTGWAVNQFWSYYRYTMDNDWLCETGYPFMRECALFLHDMLEKGEDGLYHLFPSNQGEEGFTGDAEVCRDRRQVMLHARYALMVTLQAAGIAGEEPALVAEWRDQLDHLAPPAGEAWPDGNSLRQNRFILSPPEFGIATAEYRGAAGARTGKSETMEGAMARLGSDFAKWYFGATVHRDLLVRIRTGGEIAESEALRRSYDVDLDYVYFRELLLRWRHDNGLYEGMAIANYGHGGHWTESLGAAAPLQEMLLQSWDGAVALFPCWPLDVRASFSDFRAEGAFLVSSCCAKGTIFNLRVKSLRGGSLSLYAPWEAYRVTCDGADVRVGSDELGRPCVSTEAGREYIFLPMTS